MQGELVSTPMLNCIVAACGQIGDMGRAFETFETFASFGLAADTASYNAVLQGCVAHNFLESVPKVGKHTTILPQILASALLGLGL